MKYISTFFGDFTEKRAGFFKNIRRIYSLKILVSLLLCLCLTGDDQKFKTVFEGWIRPVESSTQATEKITEADLFFETNFLDEEITLEENFHTEKKEISVALGEKQGFAGQTRELYAIEMTTETDLSGILLKVTIPEGSICEIMPEETMTEGDLFYKIKNNRAAIMLTGSIKASEVKKIICYVTVEPRENITAVPTVILLDYVKKENNLTKSY